MPGPMGGGMRGPGRRMQGGTRIENPGKVFKRLMAYIFKNYGIHFIFVLICIVLSVVASIQGTLFMQRLIDDYIMPMIGQKTPDFSNLFREIVRVAGFYLVGVAATLHQITYTVAIEGRPKSCINKEIMGKIHHIENVF